MDSSLEGEGEGSERRSPRDRSVLLEEDFPCALAFALAAVDRPVRGDTVVFGEVVASMVDGFDDEVEVEDADDRTIIPATGIRTIHRRRLSNL